jgi:prepilin signal peptidase PulO-like enzyme (type II secretory pathway)
VVFVIDFEHRLIMHPVSIVGAVLAFGIGWQVNGWLQTLIGGAVGFGSMLAFYFLGEVFARYMAKRRNQEIEEVALGFGDVNLSGIAGLFLGFKYIFQGLLFTIFAGGLASLLVILVMLIRKRYQAFTPIPYAPFLILAIIFYLFR